MEIKHGLNVFARVLQQKNTLVDLHLLPFSMVFQSSDAFYRKKIFEDILPYKVVNKGIEKPGLNDMVTFS